MLEALCLHQYADAVQQGTAHHHAPTTEAIRKLAHEGLADAIHQHLQTDCKGEIPRGPAMFRCHGRQEQAEGLAQAHGEHGATNGAGNHQRNGKGQGTARNSGRH
jgi:hypothetical protein